MEQRNPIYRPKVVFETTFFVRNLTETVKNDYNRSGPTRLSSLETGKTFQNSLKFKQFLVLQNLTYSVFEIFVNISIHIV